MERVLKRIRRRFCPRQALPGEDKARTKSAQNPLQNTLHGKRALGNYSSTSTHINQNVAQLLCETMQNGV